jgi:hypothetical protein
MQNRVGRPRGVLIVVAAVVALAAVGGDAASAGQASAGQLTAVPSTADSAYAKAKKSSSKRQRKAKVTISGSVTKQSSCDDQLLASVIYTKRDGKVDSTYATIDDAGNWSVTAKGIKAGTFKASATLVGHPKDGLLKWSEASANVKRGKRVDLDLGEVKIKSCDD